MMTAGEIARVIVDARSHPSASLAATEALVSLAALVERRERTLVDWKVVLRRSPIGHAGPELRVATIELMRAEEDVREAIGFVETDR